MLIELMFRTTYCIFFPAHYSELFKEYIPFVDDPASDGSGVLDPGIAFHN
jgi:hypothetical protein